VAIVTVDWVHGTVLIQHTSKRCLPWSSRLTDADQTCVTPSLLTCPSNKPRRDAVRCCCSCHLISARHPL